MKIEIDLKEEDMKNIKIASEIKGIDIKTTIQAQISTTFRAFVDDCKRLLG